jgi:DNA-binding MarR family transcriptional regulator
MNKKISSPVPPETGQYRSLQILDELSNNDALTQRDLSQRLGIALGLVNSYIKNLVAKGYITVRNIPSKRYAYYLTPKGFSEKSRLAYDLLQDYTRIYREAKNNYRQLFIELEHAGVKCIVFAGADEVAEFAYITLQDTKLELTGVVDTERAGEMFFGRKINPLSGLQSMEYDDIIVTSYLKREAMHKALLGYGVEEKSIKTIFKVRE